MLDRSKCKRMLVWDAENPAGEERIVIEILPDGGCFAIRADDEKTFYDMWDYEKEHWTYCEEIQEKTKRQMTHDEIFAMIQEQLKKGVMVMFREEVGKTYFNSWSTVLPVEGCSYSLNLGKTWHKLEVEE